MCGRFTLYSSYEDIKDHFHLKDGYAFLASYNIAPTQTTPVICLSQNHDRVLVPMKWGLIPHWDHSDMPRRHFNARAETVAIKSTFKQSFVQRRCLAVTNGFFEWKVESVKQPYFISMKSEKPFALAGIYESREIEGKCYETFSLITTEPNNVVASIHDRMPVIVEPHDYDRWLSTENQELPLLLRLLSPYPASEMQAYRVTPKINKPVFNNSDCIVPIKE